MKFWNICTRFALLSLIFAMVFSVGTLSAQSSGGDQISWGDDDDDEEEEVEVRDEAVITINGEELDLGQDEYEFPRELTLEISVRHLKAGSFVWLKAEKTGVKLGSNSFKSNQKGELDLEIKTGKRKGGARGEIHYFSSDGKKHVKRMKVKII